jgi:hypothetical protein
VRPAAAAVDERLPAWGGEFPQGNGAKDEAKSRDAYQAFEFHDMPSGRSGSVALLFK